MARPKLADRPIGVEISLPESIHAKLMMALYSPAEQRVPKGAISIFVGSLIRQALERLPTEQGANHGNKS